ncbi:hypothetical protein PSECIP111951_03792 [Pseudoalteromonas holothuriae]|uniref:Uncharacterized protein n=1 Tax=Pseudoalteromonas holothuriae TaxID=2963714 RepID=A0ABN8UUV0_9GAMM|nr:hypothetical protein [Pseudoalteromonas sp. CIP111951]CAH9067431.1 hypothetical protein PSECIP111951_03792 [Pseudoalteromonas sp. CIP111951]
MYERNSAIAIHQLLNRFEQGDMTLLEFIAEDIDLRIDHYKDDADTCWQQCKNKADFITLLTRLGQDIFPKGTTIKSLNSHPLGPGWYCTTFCQSFWYGLAQKDVDSQTYIISHESNGQIDYFREHVSTLVYS